MAHYKAIFIIGVVVWFTFSGVSNVQAISDVPASSPGTSTAEPPVSVKSAATDSGSAPTQKDSASAPTQDDSVEGPTEEDYSMGPTKDLSATGPAQDIPAEGPTQEDSAAGPSQEVTAAGPTQEVTASGPTQENSVSGPTQADSASGPIQENSVSGPTQAVSAPGPSASEATLKDIDINFNTLTNMADLTPKINQINNIDFSTMKIDTTAKNLCKGTDYDKECIAAILPDLEGGKGTGTFEPKDVMRLETESLLKKANATLEYAKRMLEDSKTSSQVKEAMSVCVENYDLLITNLEEAKKAMENGDYKGLETVMSAAISDLSTCSDSFAELPDAESPTASLDELLKKLSSNILVMSQTVQKQ